MRVLFDTNVILDVWLARDPFLRDSAKLMSAAETKRIVGLISPTTVTTLHNLVKKVRGEATARRLLNTLLQIFSVGVLRKKEICFALASRVNDFEDAVIEAVAIESKADVIATRNTGDFKNSAVPALEPHRISF